MTDTPKPKISMDAGWWSMGVVDGFRGSPPQRAILDQLSYRSGRIEGQAAKEHGRTIDEVLEEARVPYREAHFRPSPSTQKRGR